MDIAVLKKTIAYRFAITTIICIYMIIYLAITEDMTWRRILYQSLGISAGTLIIATTFYYVFEQYWED